MHVIFSREKIMCVCLGDHLAIGVICTAHTSTGVYRIAQPAPPQCNSVTGQKQ
jgi:hypothetical protein